MGFDIKTIFDLPEKNEENCKRETNDNYYERLFEDTFKNLKILEERYNRVHSDYHRELKENIVLKLRIKELEKLNEI